MSNKPNLPAFGKKQTYCDHKGEPENMTLAEYLRLHPHEADRLRKLSDKPSYITAALAEILKAGL